MNPNNRAYVVDSKIKYHLSDCWPLSFFMIHLVEIDTSTFDRPQPTQPLDKLLQADVVSRIETAILDYLILSPYIVVRS